MQAERENPPGNEGQSRLFFFLILWVLTLSVSSSKEMTPDPDLWGHVFYGLDHIESGELATTDPYSYTAQASPWVNHEWLTEWIFAKAWTFGGSAALRLLAVVLMGTTMALLLWGIYRSTEQIWTASIVYLACWAMLDLGFSIRPQLFSYLLFAVLLAAIQVSSNGKGRSAYWNLVFIPALLLWANLHGGFLLGIALISFLLFCKTIGLLLKRPAGRGWGIVFLSVGLSCLATLVNPYGIELWAWIEEALTVPRSEQISEWKPILTYGSTMTVAPFYLAAALSLVCFLLSKVERNWFEWGLLLATGTAAAIQVRHFPVFAIVVGFCLPRYLESFAPMLKSGRPLSLMWQKLMLLIACVLGVVLHVPQGHRLNHIQIPMKAQPFNAFQFIKQNDLQGNLLVNFNWAQAAIWYLYPDCKVAYDGRFRTVYSKSIEADYFHFDRGGEGFFNLLNKYETQLVLMPIEWIGLAWLMKQEDWLQAYISSGPARIEDTRNWNGERALLFVKRGCFPEFEARLARGDVEIPLPRPFFNFGEPLQLVE